MKKIKVLHISETFASGVYNYIKDISEYFNEVSEIETFVIFSGKREDTPREKFKTDFSNNIKLIEISMEREISFFKDLKSLSSISKKIKDIKPDIIHLHSSKAGVLGRIASKSYRKAKVFYTPNGYSFVRQDVSAFKRAFYWFIELATNQVFGGTTIACGDTEYKHAKKIGKSLLVRNGVNVIEILKYKKTREFKNIQIGTVGRLSYQKNPILFNNIAKRFPNIEFIWIGDGELKNLITSKNITVTGWLTRSNVLEKVNNFDIYLQTSLWEGLPFTIIEAMVLHKPIIAKNVIGNKDAVANEKNGFLCDSIDDFENSITKLILNIPLLKEMEQYSFMRANDLFDRDKNFKKLHEVYII